MNVCNVMEWNVHLYVYFIYISSVFFVVNVKIFVNASSMGATKVWGGNLNECIMYAWLGQKIFPKSFKINSVHFIEMFGPHSAK